MTVILSYTRSINTSGKEYEYFRASIKHHDYIRSFMDSSTTNLPGDWSITTARRLRELRTSKGLTWQKLSDEIKKECGISISADSLSNYEVTYTQNHSRSHKTKGMKIEFLKALAEFYGVSSDYLLGISDIPCNNPDIKNAVAVTGLSEKAIQTIRQLKVPEVNIPDSPTFDDMQELRTTKFPYSVQQLDILDWLLSNPRFTVLLTQRLCEYRGNCQGYYAAKNTRENEVSELYKETQGDISKEIALRENGTYSITIEIFDIQDACDRKDLALLRVQRQFDDLIREIENTLVDKNAVMKNDDQDYL